MISGFGVRGGWIERVTTLLASRLDPGLLVVFLLPSFVVITLLQPGLPRTADGYLHLLRVVEIDQCWRDGVFYPRWAPDMAFGYGYPIFNYFAPLLYHLTEVVHVVGFGFESAFKLVLMGCLLLGAWGMYSLAKDILGPRAGILAASAYIYAPFLLREVFIRGGYAQFLAMCIMPAVLWAFHRLVSSAHPVYLVAGPVLLGAVILSHNISGMLLFPFVVLYVMWTVVSLRRWDRIPRVMTALVLSLILVSFFLVPALVEKPLVKLDRLTQNYFDFSGHFLTLGEILSPSAVPDSSSLNPVWLLNLGTAQLLLGVLGLAGIGLGKLTRAQKQQAAFFPAMLFLSVFMTLPMSTPLWEHVPLLAFTEFPWRFLSTALLGAAVLAGASAPLWSRLPWRRPGLLLVAVSLLVTVACAFLHLYPQWPPVTHEELSARDVIAHELRTGIVGTTSASECLPTSVIEEPVGSPLVPQYLASTTISKLDMEALPDSASAEAIGHTVVSDEYRVSTSEGIEVRFLTFSYPGWQAFVDSQPVPITPSYPEGLITFQVPPGEHHVAVRFGDTPVRKAAVLLSVAAALIMVGSAVFLARSRHRAVTLSPGGMTEGRLAPLTAGLLSACLLALLLAKAGFIDPRTAWFRKSSPPGQVLGVEHPEQISLSDEVLFLGYDLSSESLVAGGDLSVTLYWQAQKRLEENYSVFLHLDDLRPNYISWSLSEELSPADIPTSTWTPGFYVSDRHVLSVSQETPPGVYVLRAGLYRPDTGERLPILDERGSTEADSLELARVRVLRAEPVDLSTAIEIGPFLFGDQVELLGYALADGSVKPGNYLRLLLYWRAVEDVAGDYSVFVHLVDENGRGWAQGDSLPAGGIYPTWAWIPLEIVKDEHLIPLDAIVPPGSYRLAVGLYELDTLNRLRATDSEGAPVGDQVVLPTTVEVLAP